MNARQNTKIMNASLSLDLGAYSIKMCQFQPQGKEAGVKIARQNIPLGLSGQDRDNFIVDSAKKLLLANKFKKMPLSVGLPQSDCCIRMITIPHMPAQNIPEAVKWAAKKFIVHPEEETVLSFSLAGEVIEYETKKINIVFMAVQKSVFQRYAALIQKTGLKAGSISTSCFGLANALAFSGYLSEKAVALVDLGFSAANITFFKNNQLVFTRSAPAAGEDFDELIRQKTSGQIRQEDIEEMKRRLGLLLEEAKEPIPGMDLSGYGAASSEYLEKLIKELQLSFNHFRQISHGEEAEKIVLCGGSSQLRNLAEAVSRESGFPTEVIRPPAGISIVQAQPGEDFSSSAACFGLALEAGRNPNLLLAGRRESKKGFFAGEKTLKTVVISFIALILAGLVTLSGLNMYTRGQLFAAEKKLHELSSKNSELLSLRRRLSRLLLRREIFLKLQGEDPALARILAAVSRQINPNEIAIQGINYERSGAEPKLVIRGQITGKAGASLSGALDRFISGLDETKCFKKITPNFRESADPETGVKTLVFDLDCRLDAKC